LPEKKKEKYIQAFFIVFAACVICFLPLVIAGGGRFFYYGDYNKQQIVFYTRLHDMVRSGSLSAWDTLADLGSDTVASYSFYLIGSPFFWLSTLFPSSLLPIVMPLLIALKSGIAAVGAYGLSRRFADNTTACLAAAVLFGLSGYNSANILFNHFHDAVLVLPFMLWTLERLVKDGKFGFFALTVALGAFTNYYFFFGQVIFIALYFFVSLACGHFRLTGRRFAALAFESVIGTLIAAVLLLPSAAAVANNPRVTDMLSGSGLVLYSPVSTYFFILKNLFLLPDITLINNFGMTAGQSAGCFASYIPFFSIAGVIAYFRSVKGKDHLKVLILSCGVISLIPLLNQSFSFFNAMFYGRWFYMPSLIACIMTAKALSLNAEDKQALRKSFVPSAVLTAIAAAASLTVTFLSQQKFISLRFENYAYAYTQALFSLAAAAFFGMALFSKAIPKEKLLNSLTARSAIFAALGMCTVVWCSFIFRGTSETDIMISAEDMRDSPHPALTKQDTFFRTAAEANLQNMPVLWGLPTVRYFNSTVEPTITEFYNTLGLERTVKSDYEPTFYPLMELLSVKYYADCAYFDQDGTARPPEKYLTGTNETYKSVGQKYDIDIYENTEFLPMGFAFDCYTTLSDLSGSPALLRCFAALETLILTDEQAEKYKDVLTRYDTDLISTAPSRYHEAVEKLRSRSCSSFTMGDSRFDAGITLDKDSLVFFSVPYSENWQAEVNGEKAEIVKADGGMMAVLCRQGTNTITFTYNNKMISAGMIISISAMLMLTVYAFLTEITRRKTLSKQN